jgi:hypothetical protein
MGSGDFPQEKPGQPKIQSLSFHCNMRLSPSLIDLTDLISFPLFLLRVPQTTLYNNKWETMLLIRRPERSERGGSWGFPSKKKLITNVRPKRTESGGDLGVSPSGEMTDTKA